MQTLKALRTGVASLNLLTERNYFISVVHVAIHGLFNLLVGVVSLLLLLILHSRSFLELVLWTYRAEHSFTFIALLGNVLLHLTYLVSKDWVTWEWGELVMVPLVLVSALLSSLVVFAISAGLSPVPWFVWTAPVIHLALAIAGFVALMFLPRISKTEYTG